jgi:hypothetical protein
MNSSFHVTSFLLETFTRSTLRSMTVTSIEKFLASRMFQKHRTFEYTIMVIHEFLSLINGLEILVRERLFVQNSFSLNSFHVET